MRDDESLLQQDVAREEQRARLNYEQHLEAFRKKLRKSGLAAKRDLETTLATDQFEGREAQAARTALREYDEDVLDARIKWEGRRSWIAIGISLIALIIAAYAAANN